MAVYDINRILVPDAPPEYEDHTPKAAEITGLPFQPVVRAMTPEQWERPG